MIGQIIQLATILGEHESSLLTFTRSLTFAQRPADNTGLYVYSLCIQSHALLTILLLQTRKPHPPTPHRDHLRCVPAQGLVKLFRADNREGARAQAVVPHLNIRDTKLEGRCGEQLR